VLYKALGPGGWINALPISSGTRIPGWSGDRVRLRSALAAARWWLRRSPSAGQRSEVLAYAFMALGLFFCFKLMVTGSL
jgi:hypothetical protein